MLAFQGLASCVKYRGLPRLFETLRHLDRAREQAPQRAGILCELARIHHLQHDFAQAKRLLEMAIQMNPSESLGWLYLLRLMLFLVRQQGSSVTNYRRAQPAGHETTYLEMHYSTHIHGFR